jgi:hypothetical protein
MVGRSPVGPPHTPPDPKSPGALPGLFALGGAGARRFTPGSMVRERSRRWGEKSAGCMRRGTTLTFWTVVHTVYRRDNGHVDDSFG